LLVQRLAVHHHLIRKGLRTSVGLVVESGEPARSAPFLLAWQVWPPRQSIPYLAFDTLLDMHKRGEFPPEVGPNTKSFPGYIEKPSDKGILKVDVEDGDFDLFSLCGAQIFDAIVLSAIRQYLLHGTHDNDRRRRIG